MATVPKLTDSVQQTALPGPKLDSSAPIESFGGGPALEKSLDATRRTIGTLQELHKEEKKKADDLVLQEYRANLVRQKNTELWDHSSGAFNRKGRDALGVQEEYGSRFKKFADDLDSRLSSEEQRLAARRIRLDIETEFSGQLQKHVFSEVSRFDEDSTKHAIGNEIEDGINNWSEPGKLENAARNIHAMTNAYAARTGKTPNEVKKIVEESWSQLVRGTIEAQASQEQDILAEQTFHRYKDLLTSKDRNWAQGFVGESRRDNDARRMAHDLWDKSAGDYSSALKLAEQQADSKSYPLVKKWLKEFSESKEGIEKRNNEQHYQRLSNQVWQTGERPTLQDWNLLKPEQQRALDGVLRAKRKGEDIIDDPEVFYDLTQMAHQPATKDKYRKLDLLTYQDKLSRNSLKRFMELQAKMRSGTDDHTGLLTGGQLVDAALDEAGIKNKKDRADFLLRVDERAMNSAKERGRKKPSVEDVKKIVDDEIKEISIKRSFLGIPFGSKQKRRFKTELNDFTTEEQEQAKAAAILMGRSPTPENILFILRHKDEQRGEE